MNDERTSENKCFNTYTNIEAFDHANSCSNHLKTTLKFPNKLVRRTLKWERIENSMHLHKCCSNWGTRITLELSSNQLLSIGVKSSISTWQTTILFKEYACCYLVLPNTFNGKHCTDSIDGQAPRLISSRLLSAVWTTLINNKNRQILWRQLMHSIKSNSEFTIKIGSHWFPS